MLPLSGYLSAILLHLFACQPCLVLLPEHLDYRPHILDACLDHPTEEPGDHIELTVLRVADPSLNLNAVRLLSLKILPNVVHNDGL